MSDTNERILSLDVFRGLTMALMVLVNAQGTREIYPLLEHAAWNGCTFADLVFPGFLFIVGMTTVISLHRQLLHSDASRIELYKSILKRSVLLFAFGLFLNAFPLHFDFATIRVYGILQRIAICYLICSVIYLNTSLKTQIILFWGILVGYWYWLTQIPVPGGQGDVLSISSNWVAFIDKTLLSPEHLYRNFDPEGLLSTLPAVATTLSGLLTGRFLLINYDKRKKTVWMILTGILFLILGWIWSYSFPLNKNLWTSTFVLWTSGISLITFALCFYIIDVLGKSTWALPFKIFGMNALFIFIFHVLLLKLQSAFSLPLQDGSYDYVRVVIADYLFGSFSQENASLLYALVFLLLNFLIAVYLYRKKIFFKL
ncbi:MAG: heparan-alpha-glucosaminide N-acetyltransferase domain-containing protein [Legionella sp.]|uniref:acyltransferase family protein n=1 Tax=Legionella sp. TaxID=459 RepID=UPI0039E35CB5